MRDIVYKIMLKKILPNLSFVIVFFTLDRVSKYLILELSRPSGQLDIKVAPFINFNLIWNNGIAFGLFSFNENFYYNIMTLFIIVVTFFVVWLSLNSKGLEKISFLMIIGGALGNIFDRIFYSSVIDFIDVNYNNFHWFIFNVADIFITLGVIILITLEFFNLKKHEENF